MHRELLALLLPPVSYDKSGSVLSAELAAEGAALDDTVERAAQVAGAITPFFADQLLPSWERVCGLTPPAGATYQARKQAVLAKLAETGGLSIPYFVRLAARMGYRISIKEKRPFRTGQSRAGDRVYVQEIIWVWQVGVSGGQSRAYHFRAGQSVAGERLLTFGDPLLESVFNDLKPAHTFVQFAYQQHQETP